MRRKYYLLKWRFTRWLLSQPRIAAYAAKRARRKLINDSLEFGMLKRCAMPKDTADLVRGTAWVLRNELGVPIQKVTLAKPWEAGAKPPYDTVLWERVEDDTPPEVIIARATRALPIFGDPSRYVTA